MSTSAKKFLLVTPHTFPDFSGSGLNAFRFGRYLVRTGKQVKILSLNRNLTFNRTDLVEQVRILRVLYFNRNLALKIISLTWIIPAYLIQIIQHDVILIYGSRMIGYEFIVLAAKAFGKKVIFQSLLTGIDDPFSIMVRPTGRVGLFRRFVLAKVSFYHSINGEFTKQYKKIFPGKTNWIQIPQGIDTGHFHPANAREKKALKENMGLPADRIIILSVGFIIERKRIGLLIDILSDLDIPFQFILVGEQQDSSTHFLKDELSAGRKWIIQAKEKLGDKISIAGSTHDILKYYQVADLYIHTAVREGLPNTILEAMACGLPVICPKIPGLVDFVLSHNKNCMLAENKLDFIQHIYNFNNDNALRKKIGDGGREFVVRNASFGKVAESLKLNG